MKRGKSNNFILSLSDHFISCRTFLIAFCGAVLVGILVGCFSFAKFNKIFTFSATSLFDSSVFFSKVNCVSYACRNIFKFIFLAALILLFSLHVSMFPLSLLGMSYLGYMVGSNMVLMIIVLGFTGTISMVLVYLPLNLCACFLMINLTCVCEKNCFDSHKYGKFACGGKNSFSGMLLLAFVILLIIFILLLIEGLLLPTSVKNILLKI